MIGNIDGDLVAYRCSASVAAKVDREALINLSEEQIQDLIYVPESEEIAILRTDKLMQDLLYNTDCNRYNCFITGRNNFRKIVNPDYKANRTTPPPKWLQSCRNYLCKEWNARISDGIEADDLLGISQSEESICISLDKDLDIIPGWHFNWLKNEKYYIVPLDGIRNFYKQMLIGDKSDNIFGVTGIGKVKAARLIDVCETEQEMLDKVWNLYNDDGERFWINAQCLWIMQKENETWQDRLEHLILPDKLQLVLETKLDFMKSLMDDISMGLTMIPTMMSGIQDNGDLMVVSPQIKEMTMI